MSSVDIIGSIAGWVRSKAFPHGRLTPDQALSGNGFFIKIQKDDKNNRRHILYVPRIVF
jgi:hypothetical protein